MPSIADASVARRYARALLSLALEDGGHEKVGEELDACVAALASSPEVRAIATDPSASTQNRQTLVSALASSLSLSPVSVNFLRLLVDRQRLGDLPQVARAYGAMLDEKIGRVRATVTAAQPLDGEQLSRLQKTLAAATQRTIVLESKTDPSILGGVVTMVGATQYDGSLRTQLERLRDELKQSPLGG